MVNPKMTDEEFEAFYDELFKEFGSADSKKTGAPAQKPAAPATGERRYQGSNTPAYGGSMEKLEVPASKKGVPVKQKKQKSLTGLTICLCLECLGIAGVVVWWLLRIL